MKKRFLSFLLTALMLIPMMPAASASDDVTVDVIVELSPPEGTTPHEYASFFGAVTEYIISDARLGYIYDTLLCGFHLSISEDDIPALEALPFVKRVSYSGAYSVLQTENTDMSAAEMIDCSAAEAHGLTGDGIKVAVIDNGFDVSHPAFATEVTNTVDLSTFASVIPPLRLNSQQFFEDVTAMRYNSKIPYVFDYFDNDTNVLSISDHGTHVAGIIGAGRTELSDMHGVAPGCQLLLMKVFDNDANSAYQHNIIAALEDAVKLGADVINLSLGFYAGSSDPSKMLNFDKILESVEDNGCIIIAAAGNDQVSTTRGIMAQNSGSVYPLASYTDYGTLSMPASTGGVLAVASVDNRVFYGSYLRHSENESLLINFTDTSVESGVTEVPFTEYFHGKDMEYVPVPGIGEPSDYIGIDVKGKIALVKRGTIMFTEKVKHAADNGAVGVIVYNNVDDGEFRMELTGAALPAIAISLDDGEALIAEETHSLRITSFDTSFENTVTAGKISDFSSRGTTPSLDLKPDVAGIGGYVYSTSIGGKYKGLTGTSMAAPQISGLCALLAEKYALPEGGSSKGFRQNIVNAVMNTAVPVLQDNGTEYSVRAQGAGLANVSAVLTRELEITYKENGLAKAELYDGLDGSVSFTVTLKNLTSDELTAELAVTLISDGYTCAEIDGRKEYFNTLMSEADKYSVITADGSGNVNRNSPDYSPYTVTLGGGEYRDITVTVNFDGEYHGELAKIFTNGHFAEGFVYASTDSTEVSLPYMGYIGEWESAPVTDGNAYLGEFGQFKGTLFFVPINGVYVASGTDRSSGETKYSASAVAFSPNGDGYADEILLGASILRNFRKGVLTVTDSQGNTVYSSTCSYITKTRSIIEPTAFYFHWNGGDGVYDRYKYPDGKYTFSVEYTLDYGDNNTVSSSYEVIIDTVSPELSQLSLSGGRLTLRASDESGLYSVRLYDTAENGRIDALSYSDTVTADLTGYEGEYLYYDIVDNAHNVTTGRIALSDIAA